MASMSRRGRGTSRVEGKNGRRSSTLISSVDMRGDDIPAESHPDNPPAGVEAELPQTPPEPLLFEIGWEVCWQLGGIYTVLRSKAPAMIERWEDRYFMIGPYNPETAALEYEPLTAEGFIRKALDRMDAIGIHCHYGQWLVRGRPKVILIDHRAKYRDLDNDKYLLWKDHGIATVNNDGEVNEVVAFGFAIAALFAALSEELRGTGRQVIAHFHEWMAGVAVPRISHTQLPVSTVFTTHATLLGRYIASDSPEFYNHLPFLNPDAEAAKYNIFPRFAIERAAAHSATVFTTVSEVTSFEAEKLLGRAPELILPNGLNLQRFAALHEFQNLHREYKEVIHEFVVGHFFPSYSFDLDRTIYLFTSGRYEYRNKGMDLFVEALNRLNWRLKELPDRPTVVAFIITRAATKSINVATLQSQSMFDELHKTCEQIQEQIGQRLLRRAVTGQIAQPEELLDADEVARLKQVIHAWRTGRPPSIITHDLVHDADDALLNHLRHHRLFNAADDPVKVVFHPQFMTRTSPLISLDYEQFVRGCHLGVFPSYYEPWGYTPMECVALGVPTITTDLSGFGAYVQHHITSPQDQGIYVLNRRTRSFDDSVNEMVEMLLQFVRQNRRQRIEMRNKVERLSEMFDWSKLIQYYNQAHDLALQRGAPYRPGNVEVRLV
jgi:glycogen(starch) synthase